MPTVEANERGGVRVSLLEYLHACPLCGASELRPYCRVPSLFEAGEYIRYDRCTRCDVVFRNPRLPAPARLDGYRDRVCSPEQTALVPRTQAHYRYLVRRLTALLPPGAGRRVLDFGCGAGGFLVEARREGLDAFGLELNRHLAAHVQQTYAVPVHSGVISDPGFPPHRFDLITSFEVFEHLLDPRGTLLELVRHLEPHGLLLIEVPNLHDTRERWRRGATMDDSHLFYFGRRSLTALLHACGLAVREVHEGLRPWRAFGTAAERLPMVAQRGFERVMAALQVKTALAVIAAPGPRA